MNEMIQLLNHALQGDKRAFDRLYEMTHQKAYYVALKYMKDEHQAEDVLQEAYIKAFNHLDSLQNANKFESWLHKIVYTTAMDVYRKRKRQQEHTISFTDYEGDNETTVEFEDDREEFKPEEQIDYQETQKAVLGFIDELSDSQRMSMVLFYYEQYSLKEIADVMECSVGTVKSRLNKAKQLMRDMVNGYEKKHGVALHALPLFPFFAWAFKQAAETSTVHAAPLAYTATAAKEAIKQQAAQKTVEKTTTGKITAAKTGTSTIAKKAATMIPKVAAKKIVAGVITASIAGGTIFGASHYIKQRQETKQQTQENQKQKQQANQTKKQKTTNKTKRQIMLEAYVKYLEDMDEDTRFYIADIAEDQKPVLLIGKFEGTRGEPDGFEYPKGWSSDDELYSSYDIYGYDKGKIISISKDEYGGEARGIYVVKKEKDNYIMVAYNTAIECTGVRDNKVQKYNIDTKTPSATLTLGNENIKTWDEESDVTELYDSFGINYDNPTQFYKNTKENRDTYCK